MYDEHRRNARATLVVRGIGLRVRAGGFLRALLLLDFEATLAYNVMRAHVWRRCTGLRISVGSWERLMSGGVNTRKAAR